MIGRFRRNWAWPWELRRRGVLGMNRRNAHFLYPGNPREAFPLVDDKLETKRICEQHGIPVPDTYAVVSRQGDLRHLKELIEGRPSFVVKPSRGAGGKGILVVTEHDGHLFTISGGRRLSLDRLRYHVSAVMAGLFTLSGQSDRAIVEHRIRPHGVFRDITWHGTPDVRVLLFRGVIVMAMMRLPTRASGGKANLHQGGVGVGIDLDTGKTFGGVCRCRRIEVHPDTGEPLQGRVVPNWQQLLAAAERLAACIDLEYLGVDFVLDEQAGPLVLEANARPGLAIQIANDAGLLPRLKAVLSGQTQRRATAQSVGRPAAIGAESDAHSVCRENSLYQIESKPL